MAARAGPPADAAVPVPVRVGRPCADYPWPWSVVPWLAGCPGDRGPLTAPEDAALRLAHFLRALHHQAPLDAPANPYRGVPLAQRAATVDARLCELSSEVDMARTRGVWNWASAASPWSGPRCWVHGDLHPANVLVGGGTLAAVIDFGDLCAGDPATDLAGAWLLLPPSALPAFTATYGVDAELERRAVGWVLLFALMLVGIGLDGRPTYRDVGQRVLQTVLGRYAGAG